MKDNFLNFKKVSETETELYVYGDIRKKDIIERWFGLDDPERTDALTLKEALNQVDTPNLTVRINSYRRFSFRRLGNLWVTIRI